jgi:hypothetical protein
MHLKGGPLPTDSQSGCYIDLYLLEYDAVYSVENQSRKKSARYIRLAGF